MSLRLQMARPGQRHLHWVPALAAKPQKGSRAEGSAGKGGGEVSSCDGFPGLPGEGVLPKVVNVSMVLWLRSCTNRNQERPLHPVSKEANVFNIGCCSGKSQTLSRKGGVVAKAEPEASGYGGRCACFAPRLATWARSGRRSGPGGREVNVLQAGGYRRHKAVNRFFARAFAHDANA